MNIKIDKNIPPPDGLKRVDGKQASVTSIMEKMAVGDSFAVNEGYRQLYHRAAAAAGIRITIRREGKGTSAFRVWRVQ